MALQREAKLKQIEKLKQEIYKIDSQIFSEGHIEDGTLLNSIEKMRQLYDKGNFKAIQNWGQKAMEALQSDRYFRVLKAEEVDYSSGGENYLLPQSFGIPDPAKYGLPLVIGGLPKSRKTSLAVNMLYTDYKFKRKAVFFSLELTPDQLMGKVLQLHVQETYNKSLAFDQVARYAAADEENVKAFTKDFLSYATIVEANGFSGARLANVFDRIIAEKPDLRVAYIDYFQRLRPDFHGAKGKEDTRTGYMTTSRLLTELAKRTKVALVVLSQMNNDGGYKETGAILEDAGMALVVERKSSGSIEIKVVASRFSQSGLKVARKIDEASGYVY
jgi:hypothetical protein